MIKFDEEEMKTFKKEVKKGLKKADDYIIDYHLYDEEKHKGILQIRLFRHLISSLDEAEERYEIHFTADAFENFSRIQYSDFHKNSYLFDIILGNHRLELWKSNSCEALKKVGLDMQTAIFFNPKGKSYKIDQIVFPYGNNMNLIQ
jgi:hypothetical protein